MTYSFLIASSFCMNITEQKDIHAVRSQPLPLCLNCRHASFLQLFQKFSQSPKYKTFIRKFFNKFFWFNNIQKRTDFLSKFPSLSLKPTFTRKHCLLPSNTFVIQIFNYVNEPKKQAYYSHIKIVTLIIMIPGLK